MRSDDPVLLSAQQRSTEIARLLAAGVRRLFAPRLGDVPATRKEPKKEGFLLEERRGGMRSN